MPGDKLVLFGETNWTSPYVYSCFVALKEKGLDFEMKLLSLAGDEHRRPEYLDVSLTGRVPALRHGDFWLSESSAIDEYLEDAFPPPRHRRLYPAAHQDRARARQIQAWLRSDLVPLREERPTTTVFYGEKAAPLGAAGQAAASRLLRTADRLVQEGATSLFGSFTVADADLALMLQRLVANKDPVPPKLRAYAMAVWQRPSVKEFVEHPRPPREPAG